MIKIFENAEYGIVTTALIDGQPLFCLKDICKMLDIKSISECREKLNESGVKMVGVPTENTIVKKIFITTENLSACLFQSRKAEAELICDWLYRVVLPRLKKYNDYKVYEFMDADVVINFLDKHEDLRIKNSVMETTIKLNEPKINSIDKLLGTSNCVDLDAVHYILKFKGIHNTELLKILRAYNILDESNLPLQEYCDKKYFRVVEATAVCAGSVITSKRTYVYRSGITFIEKLVKDYEGAKNVKTK